MLHEFIAENRGEILGRSKSRIDGRGESDAVSESASGMPMFLAQLIEALRKASSKESVDHVALKQSASLLGGALFQEGLTVSQVVNGYGDLCQVITGLAMERSAPISVGEFQTLNLCLDDATAVAVTSLSRQRETAIADEGVERLGALAHEMRNLLNGMMLSFRVIKSGTVSTRGSTSAILDRDFIRMQTLIDRSMADVRLEAGTLNIQRVPVWQLLEEIEIGAALVAQTMDLELVVTSIDKAVCVDADRQILAAAVANLLQNAFKFTRPGTTVRLRATATTSRVLIDFEDECGGLPVKDAEALLRPFVKKGGNRSGLGLGLSICVKAVQSIAGELHIVDHPGKGCVFTIDLPRQSPLPAREAGK